MTMAMARTAKNATEGRRRISTSGTDMEGRHHNMTSPALWLNLACAVLHDRLGGSSMRRGYRSFRSEQVRPKCSEAHCGYDNAPDGEEQPAGVGKEGVAQH